MASAEWWRAYRRTPAGHRQATVNNARARAKRRGLPFDLDRARLPLCPDSCPCCGVQMRIGDEAGGRATAPSLDCIDPARGYTLENVMWLCHRCNTRKGEWTPGEMYAMADWLYEIYRERGIPCETRLRPLP